MKCDETACTPESMVTKRDGTPAASKGPHTRRPPLLPYGPVAKHGIEALAVATLAKTDQQKPAATPDQLLLRFVASGFVPSQSLSADPIVWIQTEIPRQAGSECDEEQLGPGDENWRVGREWRQ